MVISGDIANSALSQEYEHAKTLLGALQMPFAAIPAITIAVYKCARPFPIQPIRRTARSTRCAASASSISSSSIRPCLAHRMPSPMRLPLALEVFKIEPQALHLHARLPGEGFGSVVTHSVQTGEFPGPYSYGYARYGATGSL